MSRSYYGLEKALSSTIRGTARLLNVSSSTYGVDWDSFPHTHNYMELFLITAGNGQFLIEDQLYPVNAPKLVIVNPNVSHTERSSREAPMEYIVLGIDGLELPTEENCNGQYVILGHSEESREIASCIRNVLREMELKKPGYEDICQAYLEILVIRLMRSVELSVPVGPHPGVGNRQCAAAKRYIDLHFKESLTLEQLADHAHMNKYYLSHVFKQEYGVSPMNYMTSRRIDESRNLLAETDHSMTQIAQMLGFSSLSYFSQVFRKSMGVSPMDFRQSARSG